VRASALGVGIAALALARPAAGAPTSSPTPAAQTDEAEPPTGIYEAPPKNDPPRWRLRATLSTGVGVALGPRAVSFPTHLDLGARIWGPLSVTLSGTAVLSSRQVSTCGTTERPNAALGAVGLRADLRNGRSASWVDPFIEAHVGVGGQAAYGEPGDPCGGSRVFATGGGRIGLDAWLGRVAITAQLSYDDLPVAAPIAISLGASVILY
jgi:hypothetical protein